MIKLADFVVDTIARNGTDAFWSIYGSAIGDLIDVFTRRADIRLINPQHEQAAAFMGEGWSKVTGKTACVITTSGPGALNLATGIANAFYDSVPMLFLTGNVKQAYMRPDPSIRQIGFQECPVVDIYKPITKYSVQVRDPSRIRYELEKCLFLCRDGRHGPCLLDLPIDTQQALIEPDELEPFDAREYWKQDPIADVFLVDEFIARYLADLEKAERPVMLIGGGVRAAGAVEAFRTAACKLQMPCVPTWNAVDIVTSDFPWYAGRIGTYGGAGRNFQIQNSDLLLAVGSRISGRITGGAPQTFARGAKKYLVEIDDGLLQKQFQQVPFDEQVRCDAGLFFNRMHANLFMNSFPHYAVWTEKCMEWKRKYDPVAPHVEKPFEPLDPYLFVRELSRQCPDNAIIVTDCGGNQVIAAHAFETKYGQRWFTNNSNSPMGFSFCGALGAWFADPLRPVICIIGDGGWQLNIQELQTMKHYGCAVKVFIIQNGIYGITKQFQSVNFEGREIACGPDGYSVPEFGSIAFAYDLQAMIFDPEKIPEGIATVLGDSQGWICEVQCPDFATYEPKTVGWASGIEDNAPFLPRDELRANMIIEPLPGWESRK